MATTPYTPQSAAEIVAVREHAINSRRTRVHVIVCHDLNERAHTLYEMFRFADKVSPEALAERQLAKLPKRLRE